MRPPDARILITGATGFIGRALVAALRARWPEVPLRLLVRDRGRAERANLPPSDLVESPLDASPRLCDAARDADVVVHLAGAVMALRRADLFAANAVATANLLAALPAKARVLLVSSLAAAGPSVDGVGTAAAPDACQPCSDYGESKRQGEFALLADAARSGRPWLVLRPCVVYGPGDGPTEVLFRTAGALLCPVPVRPRPLSTVHVRDVCAALMAAIEQSAVNGVFLPIGGEVTDTHALLRSIAQAGGRRARLLPVPMPLAAAAGRVADAIARLRGVAGPFSRDKVREIAAPGWVADVEPARAALGFVASVGLREGLAEVAAARPSAVAP